MSSRSSSPCRTAWWSSSGRRRCRGAGAATPAPRPAARPATSSARAFRAASRSPSHVRKWSRPGVAGADRESSVRLSVDAALDPAAVALPGDRHLGLLRRRRPSAELSCRLTTSDQSEDRTSRAQVKHHQVQGEGDGARRIRTADLLGAIQARGWHGPVSRTGDLQVKAEPCCPPTRAIFRRICADIHADMRRFGHEWPLVPNPGLVRFEIGRLCRWPTSQGVLPAQSLPVALS
jgi:hypothetical protein